MIGFNVAFFVLYGLSFLMSSFLIFVVSERRDKAKHMQVGIGSPYIARGHVSLGHGPRT